VGRTPVTALIVIDDSRRSGKPIRIITSADLPTLTAALGIAPC